MLRPKSIALVNQRRTLRALYAQTQAYPYAATLSSTQSLTDSTSQAALNGSDGASGAAGIWPGCVMNLVADADTTNPADAVVQVSTVQTTRPFGLSANFVGGNMDELNGNLGIGVWRGRGGVFEVLAPLFSSAVADSTDTLGVGADVEAGQDVAGQMVAVTVTDSDGGSVFSVARLITLLSANAIIVELTVGG